MRNRPVHGTSLARRSDCPLSANRCHYGTHLTNNHLLDCCLSWESVYTQNDLIFTLSPSSYLNHSLLFWSKPLVSSLFLASSFFMAPNPPPYSSTDHIANFDGLKRDEHSDNCCFHLLNLIEKYPERLDLGPCFQSHLRIPASLKPCLPQQRGELFPSQRPLSRISGLPTLLVSEAFLLLKQTSTYGTYG